MVEERRSQQAATGLAYYLGSNTANRYEDGYLVRDFPIKSLYVEEATPPVDELQTFNAVGLSMLTVSMHGLCLRELRAGFECKQSNCLIARLQSLQASQEVADPSVFPSAIKATVCLLVPHKSQQTSVCHCLSAKQLSDCLQVAQASQEAADSSDCSPACLHLAQASQQA